MKEKPSKESKPIPSVDELIRHQNVLFEQIRDEVKGVAEGHSSLDKKLDKTNERLDEMDTKIDMISSVVAGHGKRFDTIEFAIIENSKDIQLLKAGQKVLEAGQETLKSGQEELKLDVKRIEHKLDTVTIDHEQRMQKLETVH